jgi:hypothetical protein
MRFISNKAIRVYTCFMALLALIGCVCLVVGCATCRQERPSLPNGYEVVTDSCHKFRVKCPDGHLTECQWETEKGATGYAISYANFNEKKAF